MAASAAFPRTPSGISCTSEQQWRQERTTVSSPDVTRGRGHKVLVLMANSGNSPDSPTSVREISFALKPAVIRILRNESDSGIGPRRNS